MDLLPTEIRALGCLIEKQRTTPDAYPLTLNSLRLACNQSTNRDPVVSYETGQVRDALHRLERRGLVRFASGAGSRAAKYRHRLAERLPMDDAQQALLGVLLLRGPQTPGELKQRAERMHPFGSLADVEATLQRMIERALVVRLPRRPGQKEQRYGHLLGGEEEEEEEGTASRSGHDAERRGHHGDRRYPSVDEPAEIGGTSTPAATPSAGAPAATPSPSTPAATPSPGAPAATTDPSAARHAALHAEVRALRERVSRLEGALQEICADLGIDTP
ncbi:MAG: YceH family protein [Solirubrobacteraceae bacterium]